MEREPASLERLIEDLFTLARVEVGRLELRLAPPTSGRWSSARRDTLAPLAWRRPGRSCWPRCARALPAALVDASGRAGRRQPARQRGPPHAAGRDGRGGRRSERGEKDRVGAATCGTPARASRRTSCRASSSASTGRPQAARARTGPGWGWRWSRSWPRRWAVGRGGERARPGQLLHGAAAAGGHA